MMSRRTPFLLALLAGAIALHPRVQIEAADLWLNQRPTHKLTPVPDSIQAWWRITAHCLTGDTAWRSTSLYVGGKLPKGWEATDPDMHGAKAGAINPRLNAIWVRTLAKPTVSHQMAHMRLWPSGHPAFAFPDPVVGQAPLCGLAGP